MVLECHHPDFLKTQRPPISVPHTKIANSPLSLCFSAPAADDAEEGRGPDGGVLEHRRPHPDGGRRRRLLLLPQEEAQTGGRRRRRGVRLGGGDARRQARGGRRRRRRQGEEAQPAERVPQPEDAPDIHQDFGVSRWASGFDVGWCAARMNGLCYRTKGGAEGGDVLLHGVTLQGTVRIPATMSMIIEVNR